jgi:Polyketide cyclase / dehydrase and lipid transport
MPKLHDLEPVDAQYALDGPNHRELRKAVAVPAATLFNCLADGDAWRDWLGITVDWDTPEPRGKGTRRTVTVRNQRIEEYFFTWDEGRRMTFRFDRATLPLKAFAEDYYCRATGESSAELVWSVSFEWGGRLAPVATPVFGWIFALNGRRALRRLANLLRTEGERWS